MKLPLHGGRVLRWVAHVAVQVAALAAAGAAQAHSPIPGIGVFYSGVLHPFIAPALLVALLALGLLLGQQSQGEVARMRTPLLACGAALLAGLGAAAAGGELDTDRLLLLCGALAGLSVALAWMLPPAVRTSLAVLIGLATGLASLPTGVEGGAMAGMLAGTVLGSLFMPLWVTVVVSLAQQPWLKIAVRVLGSWLAAAALLVLSLSFAPARPAAVPVPAASAPAR